ncbi:hypothetical protein EBB07_24510 [Paenibacillaceae bacterium]|nr:hypothetical protein EBB07_24510 [Paenibacillaceae bacterium]
MGMINRIRILRRLVDFQMAMYVRSYRNFLPMAVYLIAIVWIYSVVPNPIMSSYSATAVLLYLTAAWLGISFYFTEPHMQQNMTYLHTRPRLLYGISRILTAWLTCVPLAVFAMIYPLLRGAFIERATILHVFTAVYAHLLLALLGVLLAALVCRLTGSRLIVTLGWLLIMLALSLSTGPLGESLPGVIRFIVWLLPPASLVMTAMMQFGEPHSSLLAGLIYPLIYTCALLLATLWLSERRGEVDWR